MKKLSALIALLVCVTIGGVYATWTYADTNDIADVQKEILIEIPDATLSGANGSYKIDTNLEITLDQESTTSHKAVLKFNDDAYIKITFTPADFASDTIKQNAVPTQFYFGTSKDAVGGMVYTMDASGNYSATGTPTSIFRFAHTSASLGNVTWTSETDGTFTYMLDAAAIATEIQLNADFVLDIFDEFKAFRTACTGSIIFYVTDGNATSTAAGA